MIFRRFSAASLPVLAVLAAALSAPSAGAAPGPHGDAPDPLEEKRATIQKFFEKGELIPLPVRQAVVRAAQLPPEPGMTPEQAAQLKQDSADLAKAVDQAMQLQKSGALPQDFRQGEELAVQVTGRVQETCLLLKIIDEKRQEEAVKLYVSRWQSGRTDLTPAKAAKEHEIAQAALKRGWERQKDAAARVNAAMAGSLGGGGPAGTVPSGGVVAAGGRADPDMLKRISASQRPISKPVGPEPPKPLTPEQQLKMQAAREIGDDGADLYARSEKATGVKKIALKMGAGAAAIGEGVTKLMAGDPDTVERAKAGAVMGASLVALPAAALGATGTGVTLLGLGRAGLAVGMPAMNAVGATGSVSAVAADASAGNVAAALLDTAGGKIAGPAVALARRARQGEEIAAAARGIDAAADDAKAMRMVLRGDAPRGSSGDQFRVFAAARADAKAAGTLEAPVLADRIGVDLAARDAAVAASHRQVGGVCASHSTTVCGIANGADLNLSDVKRAGSQVKAMDILSDIRSTDEKIKAATDAGRIANYEKQMAELRGELKSTLATGSAEGLNGNQILRLGQRLNLETTKLSGQGEALRAQILDSLRNGQGVVAAVKLGDEGHAVSVLGYGRDAAGRQVYEIYDSAVHRVLSVPAGEFMPAWAMVVQPKALDFTKTL
ncbi:MAG: hypothetical protein HY403_08210 [Elusimicrobia bacterium]|nr:hypothetical protein [Elusimicrobiota bacterium]